MRSLGPVWSLLKSKGINPPWSHLLLHTAQQKNNTLIRTLSLLLMAKKGNVTIYSNTIIWQVNEL